MSPSSPTTKNSRNSVAACIAVILVSFPVALIFKQEIIHFGEVLLNSCNERTVYLALFVLTAISSTPLLLPVWAFVITGVLIKPNIFCPEPAKTGATVDLDVLGIVIDYFADRGKQVLVGEAGANQYNHERLFQQLGLYDFCSEHGAQFLNLNTVEFDEVEFCIKGKRHTFLAPAVVLASDYLISVPKYKTHLSTGLSLAMKNLYGLLPDKEKWKGHALGLNETLMELNRVFPTETKRLKWSLIGAGAALTLGVGILIRLMSKVRACAPMA